jgi:hypothetical protein
LHSVVNPVYSAFMAVEEKNLLTSNFERGSARLDQALSNVDPYDRLRQIASGVIYCKRPWIVDELQGLVQVVIDWSRANPGVEVPVLSEGALMILDDLNALGFPMPVSARDQLAAAKELLARSPDFAAPLKNVGLSSVDDFGYRAPTEAETLDAEMLCAEMVGPLSALDQYLSEAVKP